MEFINTTPHDVMIKCEDQTIITVPKGTTEMQSRFRATATITESSFIITKTGTKIVVTGEPTYAIQPFDPIETKEPIGLIVSSIAAQALKGHDVGKNVTVLVPYSGPDQTKCKRENGQIVWIAELMKYTQ